MDTDAQSEFPVPVGDSKNSDNSNSHSSTRTPKPLGETPILRPKPVPSNDSHSLQGTNPGQILSPASQNQQQKEVIVIQDDMDDVDRTPSTSEAPFSVTTACSTDRRLPSQKDTASDKTPPITTTLSGTRNPPKLIHVPHPHTPNQAPSSTHTWVPPKLFSTKTGRTPTLLDGAVRTTSVAGQQVISALLPPASSEVPAKTPPASLSDFRYGLSQPPPPYTAMPLTIAPTHSQPPHTTTLLPLHNPTQPQRTSALITVPPSHRHTHSPHMSTSITAPHTHQYIPGIGSLPRTPLSPPHLQPRPQLPPPLSHPPILTSPPPTTDAIVQRAYQSLVQQPTPTLPPVSPARHPLPSPPLSLAHPHPPSNNFEKAIQLVHTMNPPLSLTHPHPRSNNQLEYEMNSKPLSHQSSSRMHTRSTPIALMAVDSETNGGMYVVMRHDIISPTNDTIMPGGPPGIPIPVPNSSVPQKLSKGTLQREMSGSRARQRGGHRPITQDTISSSILPNKPVEPVMVVDLTQESDMEHDPDVTCSERLEVAGHSETAHTRVSPPSETNKTSEQLPATGVIHVAESDTQGLSASGNSPSELVEDPLVRLSSEKPVRDGKVDEEEGPVDHNVDDGMEVGESSSKLVADSVSDPISNCSVPIDDVPMDSASLSAGNGKQDEGEGTVELRTSIGTDSTHCKQGALSTSSSSEGAPDSELANGREGAKLVSSSREDDAAATADGGRNTEEGEEQETHLSLPLPQLPPLPKAPPLSGIREVPDTSTLEKMSPATDDNSKQLDDDMLKVTVKPAPPAIPTRQVQGGVDPFPNTTPGILMYTSQFDMPSSTSKASSTSSPALGAVVYPALADCSSPVEQIVPVLSPSSRYTHGLLQLMHARNIHTVGNISSLTELQVQTLPIQSPKVETLKGVLRSFQQQQLTTMGQLSRELIEACKRGLLGAVQDLISRGANHSYTDELGMTSLHWASRGGHLNIMKWLITEAHCDVNIRDSSGGTPLHEACQNGHLEVVKYLTSEQHCHMQPTDQDGQTLLHLACQYGHAEIVHSLLSERICTVKEDDGTLLSLTHNPNIIRELRRHGANPEKVSSRHLPEHSPRQPTIQGPTIRYLSELKVTRDWYKLGQWLGVSRQKLNKFRQDYPRDEEICKNKMFGVWLGSSNATFHNLLIGLMAIGRKELAESISEKEGIVLPKEDLEEDQKLLEEAMKEGYINGSFLKVIFTGAGGVGKTHAVCLLRGVNPPDPNNRKSTDCITKAITLRVDAANDEKWEEIDIEKRQKIIAKGICAAKIKKEQQPEPPPSSQKHLNLQPQPEPEPEPQNVQQQPQVDPKPQLEMQQEKKSPQSIVSLETELSLVKCIREALMSGEFSGEILGIKWAYVVDTGGQPPFLELLSAFIKGASVCAFVFKLSESLDHRPLVEYWMDGTEVGKSYDHPLSNRQILEQSIQTIQALPSISDDYSMSPLLFVIGTHRDEQDVCTDETLEDKEEALHDIMKQSGCNFQYNPHSGAERVVFDVNAKNPEQKDKAIASTLRRVIANRMPEPQKIPLRHYGLELELEHLATTKGVISMEECRAIGDRLNFDERGLKAALKFLHRLNTLFYYPEVKEVEELIFCDPMVLIKIISMVMAHVHRIKNQYEGATREWKNTCERGLITIKQLSTVEFRSCFRSGIFTPKSLFKLFEHLLIVARVNEKDQQFFMPCLLDETTKIIRPIFENCSPLAFQFYKEGKSVYAPNGLFSALIAFLHSFKTITAEVESSGIIYRNVIRFHSHSPPADITVINLHTRFEVFAKCQPNCLHKRLPKIRSIILKGLEEAKKVRNFEHVYYNEAFPCKCPKAKDKPHLAEIDIEEKSWSCPHNPCEGGLLEAKELVWYGESPPIPQIMQEPSSQENVTPGSNVEFVVKATGMNLSYTWHYQTSKHTCTIKKKVVGNNQTLYIDKIKSDDEGFYTCTIRNPTDGTVETNPAQLTTIPQLIQEPSSQENVTPGSNVEFVVKATGINLSYTWYYQTSKRSSQKNVVGNNQTLHINKVKSDDEGFYTCTVSNSTDGTVETNPAQLTTIPQITEEPNSLENATPGKPAEFIIKATGKNLTYTWHRQTAKQLLPSDKRVFVRNTQILHIDKVGSSDEGYYVCTICNPTGGSVETKAVQLTTIPRITDEPNSLGNATPGKPAEFVVKATGKNLTYTWHRQTAKQFLPSDKRVFVGNTQILHIDKVGSSDEGYYVCNICNPTGGSVETKAVQLTTIPQITEEPNSLGNATPRKPAEFVVKATGKNLTYTWHRQTAKQLLPNDKRVFVGNTQTLHIDKVGSSDEGYYVCTICNPTGGSVETKPAQLTADFEAEQPQFRSKHGTKRTHTHFDFDSGSEDEFAFRQQESASSEATLREANRAKRRCTRSRGESSPPWTSSPSHVRKTTVKPDTPSRGLSISHPKRKSPASNKWKLERPHKSANKLLKGDDGDASVSMAGDDGDASVSMAAEYNKLQRKRDTIIRSLADLGITRELAEKLYGAKMITCRIYNQAKIFAPDVVEVDRATVLFNAVLASVELNPAKYDKFIHILKQIRGSDDLVAFIEAA